MKSSLDARIDFAYGINPEPKEMVVVDFELRKLMSLLYGEPNEGEQFLVRERNNEFN